MADAPDSKPSQSDPNAAPHSDRAPDSSGPRQVISFASESEVGGGESHQHAGHSPHRKVKLLGRVGEVEACSLLTDRTNIVVGSGLDCDLILADPLAPARAFILRHVKEHADLDHTCGSCWRLEVYPGARVFINRHIARHELIHFGDTITVGCHLLFFLEGDTHVLNRRTQVEVQGICRELISAVPTPAGYLHLLPSWRDRVRRRTAARWGGGLVAALFLALLLTPRMAIREPATDFMSVVIVPDEGSLPTDISKAILSRIGKRPIDSIARRTVKVQDQAPDSPDLLSNLAPPTGDPAVAPILRDPVIAEKSAPVLQERVVADAGSLGAGAPPEGVADGVPQLQVTREPKRLTTSATGAREVREETSPEASPGELAALPPQVMNREPPTLAMSSTNSLTPGPAPLDHVAGDVGTLGAPLPMDSKVVPTMSVPRSAPALARGASGQRQTREENVATSTADGTLQVLQPQLSGADGTDPRAVALTLTAPAAPGAAPGGRLIQEVGSLSSSDSFVVHVGPSAALGRVSPKLERGGKIQRQTREESVALAAPGAGAGGAGGDALQTFLPQAGTGDPRAVAMVVDPALKPGTAPAGRVAQDAGTFTGGQSAVVNAGPEVAVGRGTQRLTRGASGPRQTQSEAIAAFGVPGGVMQGYQPRLDGKGARVLITAATGNISHVASTGKLETNRTAVVGAMQMNSSPLDFTEYRGHRIPVARVSEALSTLTIMDGTNGHILDGSISSSEIAGSWTSGRFRVHGPGQPPAAEPATQCIVSKKKDDKGRDCLYIGFICNDPNPNDIVYTHTQGGMYTERDDSIEIFLDTRSTRVSYNHLIVNTRGKFVAYYCPDSEKGINGLGTPWDPGAEIKATIDTPGKKWTCEILIPFDRLGGVPAKGSQWPVNFSRNFRGQAHPQQVLSSWFLVYEGNSVNYHHPRLFGLFQW